MGSDVPKPAPEAGRQILIWTLVAAVVIAVFVVWQQIQAKADRDRTTDEFYCTMSGVGPFDRAPNSGKSCLDIRLGR